jgi:hypothetical protein
MEILWLMNRSGKRKKNSYQVIIVSTVKPQQNNCEMQKISERLFLIDKGF